MKVTDTIRILIRSIPGMSLLFLGCMHCASDHSSPALFKEATDTGVHFINEITENDSMNIMELEYFYRGGGVGIGDLNGDGLPDILLGGNMTSSRLYLNQGDLQFVDVTESAGLFTDRWTNGVSLVDINDDGRLDIYLCIGGSNFPDRRRNIFFINEGSNEKGIPTFIDRAPELGLDSDRNTTQAGFLDYDRDGDLDLFLIHTDPDDKNPNVVRDQKHDGSAPNTDQLFENQWDTSDSSFTFVDVSREAGIRYGGFSLGLAISDINLDGWPDIYVANDHLSNDLLYVNNGDGTFSNRIGEMITTQSYYSMGVAIRDLNADGRNDIFTLDMLPERNDRRQKMVMAMSLNKFMLAEEYGYRNQFMKNTLQINLGPGKDGLPRFSEVAQLAGIHNTDWSWGTVAADFDHDGHNDLIIANGYTRDITDMDFVSYQKSASYFETSQYSSEYRAALLEQPPILLTNYAFKNTGNLQFEDVSEEWGFRQPDLSSGMACGDLDLDGDLDLVINHINQPASIYENTLSDPADHYVRIQLVTDAGAPAIGAKVFLYAEGRPFFAEVFPVQGFQSCQDPTIHVGLGPVPAIDSVILHWPDGYREGYYELLGDRTYRLKKGLGTPVETQPEEEDPAGPFCFRTDTLDWMHRPFTAYDDFYAEPLRPQSFSKIPPMLAPADIDGNGTLDFFISSGPKQKGTLFFQSPKGGLEKYEFEKGGAFEDMDGEWIDADRDGDLDLFVTSGGTRYPEGHPSLQDRLYLNTRNHFERAEQPLPDLTTFTKAVVKIDFDQDGDDDLFIGGRAAGAGYARSPRSYLLENEGGTFSDVSDKYLPDSGRLGMISTAETGDLDQNGTQEIVIAGEWMPIRVLEWSGTRFSDVTARYGHGHLRGWWQSIKIEDINQDGFPDILAGNLGLNNAYAEYLPLKLFTADLDQNGEKDPLLGWHAPDGNGARKLFPVALRDDLTSQIPLIKTTYPNYSTFSTVTIRELLELTDEPVEEMEINTLESLLFLNQNGEAFSPVSLPRPAQWGPGMVLIPGDFDRDGEIDLLCAGNSQDLPVSMGWNDASVGALLLGRADGFSHLPNETIRLSLPHQVRDGLWINQRQLVLANYAGAPILLTVDNKRRPMNDTL